MTCQHLSGCLPEARDARVAELVHIVFFQVGWHRVFPKDLMLMQRSPIFIRSDLAKTGNKLKECCCICASGVYQYRLVVEVSSFLHVAWHECNKCTRSPATVGCWCCQDASHLRKTSRENWQKIPKDKKIQKKKARKFKRAEETCAERCQNVCVGIFETMYCLRDCFDSMFQQCVRPQFC